MDFKYKLTELKKDISKEPTYSSRATASAHKVVDELIRVITKGYNKVSGSGLVDVSKQLGSPFGTKSAAYMAAGGRSAINFKIDSIKDSIIMSRFIPNDLSSWAVTKLNSIKRM